MSLDLGYTDYEANYNNVLRTESEEGYAEALAAKKAENAGKTDGVMQTGNTAPSGSPTLDTEERQFESVEAYLEYLKLEYPASIFEIGDFNGDTSELSGIGSILLSPKLLEKMLDDPAYRNEMEKSIEEIDEAEMNLRLWYESNNSKVLGHGAVIDANGQAKTWSFILEDLNSMEKLGSTSAFMKMEVLREKASKLNI